MDSEQVVSNPYQELQSEALDNAKKTSLTERLTAVRNNVCEHNLRTKTTHLEKERTHRLRNLHMDTSNLRYQVKVMDIDKRKNDLAMQRRIDPKKDFSFDNRQIQNSAKRLGITSEESFYLDKKLQYPLRGNILRDHNAKPLIKKAKKMMADHTMRKKSESEKSFTSRPYDRAMTAHTVSTTVEIPSPEPPTKAQQTTLHRNGSKSAPPPRVSASEPHYSTSRLSVIDETDSKLPSIASPSLMATGGNISRQNKSHVKFKVTTPPFRQSTPEKLQRSRTYYPGMARVTRSYSDTWDSDDSDDDYTFTEKVDLRALFFSDKSQSGDTKSTISGITTPRTAQTRMSTEIPPQFRAPSTGAPKVTEEMMNKEQQEIKDRIDRFLGTMKKDDEKRAQLLKEQKLKEEAEKETEAQKLEKESLSKAAIILKIFSKPIDPSKIWGFTAPTQDKSKEKDEKTAAEIEAEKPKKDEADDSNKTKKLWQLIKTNVQNGNVEKRKYTANELLLQQLTGILIHTSSKTNIPTNSASRALRHTPTFKMRRVVEELMRQRTRYEQQQIEKLQQQETGETNNENSGPTRAWATPTAELEQES